MSDTNSSNNQSNSGTELITIFGLLQEIIRLREITSFSELLSQIYLEEVAQNPYSDNQEYIEAFSKRVAMLEEANTVVEELPPATFGF